MTRLALASSGAAVALVGALAFYSHRDARRIERQAPPDGAFLTVDGVTLHYVDRGVDREVDRGAGRAIVMIHGLGGQLRNFSYVLLNGMAADHRVILVDRPGSGYSDAAEAADVSTQAAVIGALIRRLGLVRPVVVGHSLGGAVALALALDHPDCVGSLALIAPATQLPDERPAAFRMLEIGSPIARAALAWTIVAPASRLAGTKRFEAVFAPEPVPEDFGTAGGGDLSARPGAFQTASADYAAIEQGLQAIMPRYPTLSVPVRVLFGRDDAILDPELHGSGLVTALPSAELDLIDGGHMIPITRPAEVERWLRKAMTGFGVIGA